MNLKPSYLPLPFCPGHSSLVQDGCNSHTSSLIISFLCESCLLEYYQSWRYSDISYFRSNSSENVINCTGSWHRQPTTAIIKLSECTKEEAGWCSELWAPRPPPALSINSLFCLQKSPSLLKQCLTAGTAACFADLVTFPLDTVKVRQQVQGQVMTAGAGVRGSRSILGTVVGITR